MDKSVEWDPAGEAIEDLRCVDVFDTYTAEHYLTKETTASYSPPAVTFLERLAQTCRLREDTVPVSELVVSDLPPHWRTYPAPAELQAIGTKWLSERRTAVLIVPSAINPLERNLLLNPGHADMKRLRVEPGQPFQFDPRMFGK